MIDGGLILVPESAYGAYDNNFICEPGLPYIIHPKTSSSSHRAQKSQHIEQTTYCIETPISLQQSVQPSKHIFKKKNPKSETQIN